MQRESRNLDNTTELLVKLFAPAVLLTLKQVAQVTGQAEQTLRNLISEERTTLPNCKVGGKRVVHILDLANWLDQQRIQTDQQVRQVRQSKLGRPTKAERRRGQ